LPARLFVFVSIVQSILFLGHWFLYVTLASFLGSAGSSAPVKIALFALSVSFIAASICAWYSFHPLVRTWYTISAVWMGFASFFLYASVICWAVYGGARLAGLGWQPHWIAAGVYGSATFAGIYGLINAAWLRVTRIKITLPNLPSQWRGRTAALISDTHLGHVRNHSFVQRLVRKVAELRPDIVFIAGDLYDGTAGNFEKMAEPWKKLTSVQSEAAVPHGVWYIAGNHEEFYGDAEYLPPLLRAGVRELNNEKVDADGLQIIGAHYRDAAHPDRYRQILRGTVLDRTRASVLLLHAPVHLGVAEEAGINLQLSGHTHGGQFFPYTWIAGRVWGKFLHGLEQSGNLKVYTNYGAGTWGPPMRVGTHPEIVLIEFE
jgi:predicted MPP superfamily phosphohydrolase